MLKPNNNNNNSFKGKTEGSESITFRIGKPILNDLRQEAKHKLKSINTLVNQIIKLYITWHKPARLAKYGYFDTILVSNVMNLLTEEQIIQMTKQYCDHRVKDLVYMLDSENFLSSFIDTALSWLEASGFAYKYNSDEHYKTLVIQFDMGRNWSLFFKTYMQYILEYYEITDSKCDFTDNTVFIKFKN